MQDVQCYTTYFGMMSKLPRVVVPVSITAFQPKWFGGVGCTSLRPPVAILSAYRNNEITCEQYAEQYRTQVLFRLDAERILFRLQQLVGPHNIPALACFERSGVFCHRHIVAEWFQTYNICCKEWRPEE